jgi:hypothetical protein
MMDDIAEQQDVAKEISEAISNPVAFGSVSGTRREFCFTQCSGSMTFWYGYESADLYLWLTDPDPALFGSDLQDHTK